MNGRMEHGIILDKKIKESLKNKPAYLSEWYTYLKANDYTYETCKDYITKISNFINVVSEETNTSNVTVDMFTPAMIDLFFNRIKYKTYSNGTTKKTSDSWYLSNRYAMINFFDFLKSRNLVNNNYVKENIRSIKYKDLERINNERVLLTKEDFAKIKECARLRVPSRPYTIKQVMYYRDYAILNILMYTGIRVEELMEINLDNIDFEKGELTLVTKGGKIRTVIVKGTCMETVKNWLKWRKILLIKFDKETDAVFINKRGDRITYRVVCRLISNITEEAIGKKITPHKFRSGCISILYNKTKDIEFCRRFIGHSRVDTTQRYIITDGDEKEKGVDLLFEEF